MSDERRRLNLDDESETNRRTNDQVNLRDINIRDDVSSSRPEQPAAAPQRTVQERTVRVEEAEYEREDDDDERLDEQQRRYLQVQRTNRIIIFVTHVIVAFIALRFILKALGANPSNPFANFLFSLTFPFVAPFLTLFGAPPTSGAHVFEISLVVAIIVYYFLAWVITKALSFVIMRPVSGA